MQTSFDDLGTPLCDVTFVVLDLETTGGSPDRCAITEVGALRFRGGECLGTFQTLVNPGVPIPPEIVYLTGITEAMVLPAPRIEAVLPALVEFIGDAVIVGHNVRFDMGFLQAGAARLGYGRLAHRVVDTCALARRLVREEVPNCKLATLARHFRTAADPCHRALDDARATAEVFHALLERAARLGVLALDDLVDLPRTARHPQAAKLAWTTTLPRRPGVYVFRDGAGRALYVGKAANLRARVRSYFSSDDRRKIGPLLREARQLDHVETCHELEAAVLEVRMIQELAPRFNRTAKNWQRYVYVKLTLDERFPRLAVVRRARPGDGCLYVGPFASSRAAQLAVDALHTAFPLRRCNARIPATLREPRPACTPAQLGVAACPCSATTSAGEYAAVVARVVGALSADPHETLGRLRRRMADLAAAHRFEEAAAVRDRAGALSRTLQRQRRLEALRAAGRLLVEVDGEGGALVEHGRLVAAWRAGERPAAQPLPSPAPVGPIGRDEVDELGCVAAWLDARADRASVVHCTNGLAWPGRRLPRFEPARAARAGVA